MDPRWIVRRYLRKERASWPPEQADALGLVYRGPTDFVLQHGRWWRPVPLPAGVREGAPRKCFGNAIAIAALHNLRYVEGWALPVGSNLPVHHGWNADAAGNAVDVTWIPPGAVYLGVEFALWRADDATWNGDASVLNDYIRRFPLLRQRWQGEQREPPADWTPSVALAAAFAAIAGHGDLSRQLLRAAQREAAS